MRENAGLAVIRRKKMINEPTREAAAPAVPRVRGRACADGGDREW